MPKYQIILFLFIFVLPLKANAEQWKPLIGYTLHQLYDSPLSESIRTSEITGVTGLSWPDGRQAIVTYIETRQSVDPDKPEKKWLFKCIDWYQADMQPTGQSCYELVDKTK